MKRKNYKISHKVFKFPYNANYENNNNKMLSEQFCCYAIKIRKKIKKGIGQGVFYVEFSTILANAISQSVTLPLFPTLLPKIRVNEPFEKVKCAPIIENRANKVTYIDSEIDELQQLVLNKFKKGYDVQEVINMLRAGVMDHETAVVIAIAAVALYMMYVSINKVEGFHPADHHRPRIGDWGNPDNGGPQPVKGSGPRSITVTGATNSGFERNLIQNAYSQIPDLTIEGTRLENYSLVGC